MKAQQLTTAALWCAALGLAGLITQGCGTPQGEGDRMESRVDQKMQDTQEELAKSQDKAWQDLVREKREIASDLRALRDDLDDRIDRADKKLASGDLKVSEREEWMAYRSQLNEQRRRVEKALDDINDADTDTWKEVKTAVERSSDAVDTWLEREAEKIDKKTKADADEDGH